MKAQFRLGTSVNFSIPVSCEMEPMTTESALEHSSECITTAPRIHCYEVFIDFLGFFFFFLWSIVVSRLCPFWFVIITDNNETVGSPQWGKCTDDNETVGGRGGAEICTNDNGENVPTIMR